MTMPPTPTPQQRSILWDAVRREKDVLTAVQLTADIGEQAILESEADRNEIRENMSELYKILVGNGDPSHSMIARVDAIEKQMTEVIRRLTAIMVMLIGDETLNSNADTLLDKVKRHEQANQNQNRLVWALIAGLIGDVIARILKLY